MLRTSLLIPTMACVMAVALLGQPPAQVSAHEVIYTATLSGAAEASPNNSAGVGTAKVTVDYDLSTMRVEAQFSGLTGTTTAAHIHCCTTDAGTGAVGVATPTPTFPGFPSGVTSGTYDSTFDLTQAASYNGAFVTANGSTNNAMSALLTGLESGKAYLNIHSSSFQGGEIRGFFVPEPSSALLVLLGSAFCLRRPRR